MAGTGLNVSIDVDDKRFKAAIAQLHHRAQHLEPVYNQIAARLLASAQNRFDTQTDPDGNAWEPLKNATRLFKAKKGYSSKILTRGGNLRSYLNSKSTDDYALVGSNEIYARIHQLGGEAKTSKGKTKGASSLMPARPYLGVDDSDAKRITDIITSYLSQI